MNITILDDYQDTIRTLACFGKAAGHHVTIWNDHTKDVPMLAARLKDTEALALIRERTPIRAPLLERLDKLRLISQAGVYPHLDVEACTRRGVIVSSYMAPGRPSYATAELTWGLIIAALRRIPQEIAALRAGKWQAYPIGTGLRGKALGIYGYGRVGAAVSGYGKAVGLTGLARGSAASPAHDRQRDLHPAPRLRGARRAGDHVQCGLRPDPRLRERQAGQRREPRGAGLRIDHARGGQPWGPRHRTRSISTPNMLRSSWLTFRRSSMRARIPGITRRFAA